MFLPCYRHVLNRYLQPAQLLLQGTSIAIQTGMNSSPSLNVADVTRIAQEAARSQSDKLRVMGVTVGDGDGDYAEVIIDLEECRAHPCRVSVGVFRNASPDAVRDEIVKHLERHVREHGM